MTHRSIHLFDVRIDNILRSEAMVLAETWLDGSLFHHVVTPGPEFLLEATANPEFQKILNDSDLSLPDGIGVYLAARLTGQRLRERITGVDFVHDLMRLASKRGSRVFLYGSAPGVADRAAQKLLAEYPGLAIVGTESGQRGPWQKLNDQRIVERINLAQPDILLVALGAPKQELWIKKHRHMLQSVKIAVGVGRTFDYLAGTIQRAPKTMRRLGLEWLHTYISAGQFYQPQHRRKRVMNATWHFSREFAKQHMYGRKK